MENLLDLGADVFEGVLDAASNRSNNDSPGCGCLIVICFFIVVIGVLFFIHINK